MLRVCLKTKVVLVGVQASVEKHVNGVRGFQYHTGLSRLSWLVTTKHAAIFDNTKFREKVTILFPDVVKNCCVLDILSLLCLICYHVRYWNKCSYLSKLLFKPIVLLVNIHHLRQTCHEKNVTIVVSMKCHISSLLFDDPIYVSLTSRDISTIDDTAELVHTKGIANH